MKEFTKEREVLCSDLIELIRARSEGLTELGFNPEMARFAHAKTWLGGL